MTNKIIDKIKPARYYVIFAGAILLAFAVCSYRGQRILDVFGTQEWEQEGPGSSNHYHK